MYFSLCGERKVPKERHIRENLRFSLMYPFPLMMRARGEAAFDCAPYTPASTGPSCRQACRPTRMVTEGLPRVGVLTTVGLSYLGFFQKGNFAFPSCSANTFPSRASSARPSWSARLPTTRHNGYRCVWRAIIVA